EPDRLELRSNPREATPQECWLDIGGPTHSFRSPRATVEHVYCLDAGYLIDLGTLRGRCGGPASRGSCRGYVPALRCCRRRQPAIEMPPACDAIRTALNCDYSP